MSVCVSTGRACVCWEKKMLYFDLIGQKNGGYNSSAGKIHGPGSVGPIDRERTQPLAPRWTHRAQLFLLHERENVCSCGPGGLLPAMPSSLAGAAAPIGGRVAGLSRWRRQSPPESSWIADNECLMAAEAGDVDSARCSSAEYAPCLHVILSPSALDLMNQIDFIRRVV